MRSQHQIPDAEAGSSRGARRWQPPRTSRDKVLDAALKLFDENGYVATTIEDVRLQSEVSVGSIYHHFGSKEGIAGALYVDSLDGFQRGLLAALRGEGAEAGVRAGVAQHLGWVEANRARARFLMRRREAEVVAVSKADVALLNNRLFAALAEWHGPLAAAGAIRDLEIPLLCAIWWGPAQEYARGVLESGRGAKSLLADAEPALADAAWAALAP